MLYLVRIKPPDGVAWIMEIISRLQGGPIRTRVGVADLAAWSQKDRACWRHQRVVG